MNEFYNGKTINEISIERLINKYKKMGLSHGEICERFRILFGKRGWGGSSMKARLTWYGL